MSARGERRGVGVCGVAALIAIGCATEGGGPGPTELTYGPDAREVGYLLEYDQDVEWGSSRIERKVAARYGLSGREAGSGFGVRLDSLFVAYSTPHGRSVVDSRHLVGSEFAVDISTGGRPRYSSDAPLLEMPGNMEGRLSLDRVLDFAFPVLPEGPVDTGDTWSAQWEAVDVEAHVHATAALAGEFRLAGWAEVEGRPYARIEARIAGDVTAAPHDLYGATVEFSGTLDGTAAWLFDPATGTVHSAEAETASEGTLVSNGNATAIRQTTRVRITR